MLQRRPSGRRFVYGWLWPPSGSPAKSADRNRRSASGCYSRRQARPGRLLTFNPPDASATRPAFPPDRCASSTSDRMTARRCRSRRQPRLAARALDRLRLRGARRGALLHQGDLHQARLCGRDQRGDAARAPHAAVAALLCGDRRCSRSREQAAHRTAAPRPRPRAPRRRSSACSATGSRATRISSASSTSPRSSSG